MTKNHGSNWRGWLSKSILTLVGLASFIACVGENSAHAKWSTYALTASAVNADRVSAGSGQNCAINYKNQLYCWGRNKYYEVGNGVNSTPYPTAPVYIMDGVSSVYANYARTFIIKTDGSLWGFGCAAYGSFGDGVPSNNVCVLYTSPKLILSNTTPVRKLVPILQGQVCAILVNGQVRCWGLNDTGQLGIGVVDSSIHLSSTVSLMTNAVDLASSLNIFSGYSSCAVKSTGEVYCWGGSNMPGQTWGPTPTKIIGISNAIQIVAGQNSYCVLERPGGVVCWGENDWGQLGNGTTIGNGVLTGLTNVVGLPSIGVTSITSMAFTYCARIVDGRVYCWGSNDSYQVGNGTNVGPVLTPYQTIASGATDLVNGGPGSSNGCAIMAGGSLNCWGYQSFRGVVSDPIAGITYPTPTQVIASGLISVPSTSTGGTMSCAVKTNNNVNCWGQGYLGNGLNNPANSNVTVSGLTDAVQVGTSHNGFGCALRANGTVACWGKNNFGYLGNGSTTDSLTPVQVSGLSGMSALAVFDTHSCALTASDGIVYCWGLNAYGQLGRGVSGPGVYYTTPVRYLTATSAVAIGGNESATCVLTASTYLYCSGQAGFIDNGTAGSDTPVLVIPGSNFIAMTKESAADYTCGLNGLGDLWCWGSNSYGQLGEGSTTARLTHTKSLLTEKILSVGTSYKSNCVHGSLKDGNVGVYCWGYGSAGGMGDGTTNTINTTAHQPTGLSDPADLGEGDDRIVRHTTSGNAYAAACWGDNTYRQLDNATTASFSATPVTMVNYPQ